MLRLQPAHERDTVWDALLPAGVTVLPPDLARVDELLSDPALLAPFRTLWRERDAASGRQAESFGRPTIAMATYVRLMVLKARTGWGYATLVREVSDSLHLRRFCLIPLSDPVPTESTVRKLTRRLGPDVVAELIRGVIALATRERRFAPRAMRTDSTVVEADVRYPTDAGLAATGVRLLAAGPRVGWAGPSTAASPTSSDRSRAVGRRLRAMTRTLRRRTGEARDEVLRLTAEAGVLLERSVREARRALAAVREKTSPAARRAIERLEVLIGQATTVDRPDRQAGPGRADQRPARVLRRPRRSPGPQGQDRDPDPVRLCQPARRADRLDQARQPRAHPAAGHPPGLGPREPAPAGDGRRAAAARTPTGRGRLRRGLRDPRDPRRARRARHRGLHRRQRDERRLTPDPSAARPLPGRLPRAGSPTSNAQYGAGRARLRGADGRGDLGELGGPRLRRRHRGRPAAQTAR